MFIFKLLMLPMKIMTMLFSLVSFAGLMYLAYRIIF
jgi:hypothetical protein